MATVVEQRQAFIQWANREIVAGSTLRSWVQNEGFDRWQFSLMLGTMAKEGLVEALGPFQHEQGKTYRKSWRVTDEGHAWCDGWRAAMVEPMESNTSGVEAKADETPGRWFKLPDPSTPRSRVLLKDKGYQVGFFIRLPKDDAEGKA